MSALDAILPPSTHRRELAKGFARAAHHPRTARRHLNRHNITEMWAFRDVEMCCTVCAHRGRVLFEMQDIAALRDHRIGLRRETLRCRACRSKMRDRVLALGLLEAVEAVTGECFSSIVDLAASWPDGLRVLETDAASRLSRRLAGRPGVVSSLFIEDAAPGQVLDEKGTLNVDLQYMPFADSSFDIILTTEVMEHVRFPDAAHREIARCLAPDGRYVFTVPYDPGLVHTWELIDARTDQPLVLPMHMHGDPELRAEGIKSYRVFGPDIVDDMHDAGLSVVARTVENAAAGIFGGDLFVARLAAG